VDGDIAMIANIQTSTLTYEDRQTSDIDVSIRRRSRAVLRVRRNGRSFVNAVFFWCDVALQRVLQLILLGVGTLAKVRGDSRGRRDDLPLRRLPCADLSAAALRGRCRRALRDVLQRHDNECVLIAGIVGRSPSDRAFLEALQDAVL
jgi:hypothetical protein